MEGPFLVRATTMECTRLRLIAGRIITVPFEWVIGHACRAFLSSMYLRCRSVATHAAVESAQGVQRVIEGLIFLDGIGAAGE
jgi:hypothetical protein